MPMRTLVYVDGFNLYYGAIRFTAHKWLNIRAMCKYLLDPEQHQLATIKYFTARVSGKYDAKAPVRQQVYMRALRTLPDFEIIYGRFLTKSRNARLIQNPERLVQVARTEEKGSDVNLATAMVTDGFENKYDCAVVVSNDSDLAMPVSVVARHLNKCVGILNPYEDRPSKQLKKDATFMKPIRSGVLRNSQFPEQLTDAKGCFERSAPWAIAKVKRNLPRRSEQVEVIVLP